VVADLYETELPLVRIGQEATIQAAGDFTFKGRVSFIAPTLDEKTRTGQVRLEVPNPDLLLKPQMFARVEIHLPLGEKIVVPTEAVFDQGNRQYLYLAKGGGNYEPREVTLGARAQVTVDGQAREVFVVEKGVTADESVVVSGNFLLDSESNQRASAAGGTATMKPEHHH
jgi:Cu(I)/Ag(I) efflux system membrane fusion protein